MATQIQITDADLAALVQAATATLTKIYALVDKCDTALDAIKATADAGTQAVPAIEADAKEMADAAKNLHGTGPLGTKFSTQP